MSGIRRSWIGAFGRAGLLGGGPGRGEVLGWDGEEEVVWECGGWVRDGKYLAF